MDNNHLTEQITQAAAQTIELAKQQIPIPGSDPLPQTTPKAAPVEPAKNDIVLGDSSDVARSFEGLPIENLICGPIIAAAKGQQELTSVYIDNLMRLAYTNSEKVKAGEPGTTNLLKFDMQRPVTNNDGSISTETFTVQAPLLSLVPVPAFTMDELTVDFNMEVKTSEAIKTETKAGSEATVGYKSCFGLNANITGSVSSDSLHKRDTDSSATYNIHARAVQQPPSEGMAKLTSLFAQMMEPIPAKDLPK